MLPEIKKQADEIFEDLFVNKSCEKLLKNCKDDVLCSAPYSRGLHRGKAELTACFEGVMAAACTEGRYVTEYEEIDSSIWWATAVGTIRRSGVLWDMTVSLIWNKDSGISMVGYRITSKEQENIFRLSEALERYRIVFERSDDLIFEWDWKSDILLFFFNSQDSRVTKREDSLAKCLEQLGIHPSDVPIVNEMAENLKTGKESCVGADVRIKLDSGYNWFRLKAVSDIPGHRVIGVLNNVDKEKQKEIRLIERAESDGLTGLYNKEAAERYSDRYIRQAEGELCALMIIDIDNFKSVNDTLGHLGGDIFLADVAHTIKTMFRDGDIVGRIGGDEFAVLMKNIPSADVAGKKAARLLSTITEVFREKHDYGVSCSIGIALSPENGSDYITIYRNADTALYRAKTDGKNRFAFFEENMLDKSLGGYRTAVGKIDTGVPMTDAAEDGGGRGFAEYIFRMLYDSDLTRRSIENILELICIRYGASAAAICRKTSEGYMLEYFWNRLGIEGTAGMKVKLQMGLLGDFDSKGCFFCSDMSAYTPEQRAAVACPGTESFVRCAVKKNGKEVGMVAFDNDGKSSSWGYKDGEALRLLAQLAGVFAL